MNRTRRASVLVLLNTTLLLVHQIDSASWHEWNMFHLPGGNQLNLFLNIPIVALLAYAYGAVSSNAATSRFWIGFNASLGLLTLAIHAAFFMLGHSEFLQPVSLFIFCAIAVCSILQLFGLAKGSDHRPPATSKHAPVT